MTDDVFNERGRSAVDLSVAEARALGHESVSDAHLLLGLLHARRGIAARTLRKHGITLKASRATLGTV